MRGINNEELLGAVEEVCTVLLGEEFFPVSGLTKGLPIVSCCITLMREEEPGQNYLLLVNCDNNLLDVISETIFGQDIDQIELDDVFSALREVANMIAGAVIRIMEREFDLGLPCTMDVINEPPSVAAEDVIADVTLKRDQQFINVMLTRF